MVQAKYRTYNWKGELSTWMQPRCSICGRFLSKTQRLYCKIHAYLKLLEYHKKLRKKQHPNGYSKEEVARVTNIRRNSEIMKLNYQTRNLIYRHSEKFNIGDVIN